MRRINDGFQGLEAFETNGATLRQGGQAAKCNHRSFERGESIFHHRRDQSFFVWWRKGDNHLGGLVVGRGKLSGFLQIFGGQDLYTVERILS